MLFETPTARGMESGIVVSPGRTEATPVSHMFFHPRNVEALHTSIRYEVYRRTGKVIDRQGDNQLRTLITGVYADSQSPTLESAVRGGSVAAVVGTLNARVISRAAGEIVSAMDMHRFYMQDIANPVPLPLRRSEFADRSTGLKTPELPVGF
eukprot:jgi/Tetstr1/454090/TSEL_041009.t1